MLVSGIVLSLAATSVSAPGAAASPASECVQWDGVDGRVEVTTAADLDDLGADDDCDGLTVFQVNDIDLDGWAGPSGNWFGTFDGNGFRFFDSTPLTAGTSLFDDPDGTLLIENVVRRGDIGVGDGDLGALVGNSLFSVTIEDSSASGDVSAESGNAGGLVGRVQNEVTIIDSNSSGDVTSGPGGYGSGGLIGYVDLELTVTNSFSTGAVTGSGWAGGLFGYDDLLVTINGSYSSGDVSGEDYVGGLGGELGKPFYSTITDSYAVGDVDGDYSVGGLLGYTYYPVTIIRSFSTGDVSGVDSVGGLVGNAAFAYSLVMPVIDSYATGDITGTNAVGGLMGGSFGQRVESSYALGEVTGLDSVGPLVGLDYDTGTIPSINSFGLSGRTNCDTGAVNVCASANELRSRQFLADENGWDFDTVWCVRSSLNHGFPVLRTINFGPGDTNNCRSRHGRPTRQVTLDPAGGSCGEHSTLWTIGFRRTRQLPTATDCVRFGYVFLGWTNDASKTSDQDLLTTSVSRSGSLTAVWGALPPAPGSIAILANAWCTRCSSALVIWSSVSDDGLTAEVSVDGTEVECAESGNVGGFGFCWISGLESGSSHSVSLAWRNKYGVGPASTTSFSLN